jgi:uncharacterized membrane protein YphA (DoxX/SURF4 family)
MFQLLNLLVMELIKRLNKWAYTHTYFPIDILRIALGVYLFLKGINFFRNSEYFESLILELNVDGLTALLGTIHVAGLLHFGGGILIVFGLLTRISLIIQLPFIIGAILINFMGTMDQSNLLQASLVLLVSLLFIIYGSGKHSVDYDLKMEE